MQIPKREFYRNIWCPKCFDFISHAIFFVSTLFRNNEIWYRYTHKCKKCGKFDTSEIPQKDFKALLENQYE